MIAIKDLLFLIGFCLVWIAILSCYWFVLNILFKRLDKCQSFNFTNLTKTVQNKYKNWDDDFLKGAILEYSRFMYLKKLSNDTDATIVSPSGIVDKIWHTHLDMPKDYNLLQAIYGLKIGHNHHGGDQSDAINRDIRYRKSWELYKQTFKTNPPALYWETPEEAWIFQGPNGSVWKQKQN